MEGFFPLQTPIDLREKLRRDLAKIEAAPLDADAYFNFFVTADHMLDWIHPGRKGDAPKHRERIREESVLLGICYHLSNSGKHFRAEGVANNSVKDTDEAVDLSFGYGTAFVTPFVTLWGGGPSETRILMVHLKDKAEIKLGKSIPALDLARQVLAFWDSYPLDEVDPPSP